MTDITKPNGRAIILFSRSWQALTCIRSLGMRGIDVIAADEYAITTGNLSKFSSDTFEYANPRSNPEQFLDDLVQAIERYAPGPGVPYVLIPTQRETRLIAQNADRFEQLIDVAAPDIALVEKVSDKGWLANYASEQGVPIPKTWYPKSEKELRVQLENEEFPVIVKIRSGIAGIGLKRCDDIDEAGITFSEFVGIYDLAENQAPIVQQAVHGNDYCVCALVERGIAKGITTYRNVGKLSGAGSGMVRETVSAPAAEQAAETLLKSLDWHGVAQLDFVWSGDDADQPCLIDINARLFSGLSQIVASGVDFPWFLFQMASGIEIPEDLEPELGVRTETPVLGMLSTLREVAEEFKPGSRLELAWEEASSVLGRGKYAEEVGLWLEELQDSDTFEDRLSLVNTMLEEHEQNIYELFDGEDPRAILGLLYPVVIYLRYGEISRDILSVLKAP